ncbi:putative Sulfurtransferase [Candidatus Sulfobium mesophilum]|uniref:Putative Sulfurtransferase n=1 Tax=Candidatus Sulfobium mesophilum TaxID=2016548 RepID=A0A2U3QEV6_9BACT|nr:putative Sulfurtransferase [Candidatus Sulfobium mesophilum]
MEITDAGKKIENLSIDDARELVAGKKESEILILDVRQPEEYRSGHLPGAAFMPLSDLIDKAGELDPSKPVLAYCRSGSRSRAAAAFLLSEGFSKVYSMDGGIMAWNGQVATGNYDEGLFLIKGRGTTGELISLALALEEGSRIFYTSVAELTSDAEAKKLLTAIAEAEAKHKTNILEAYKLVTGEEHGEDILDREPLKGVMESGIKIEDAVSFLGQKGNTLIEILEVSMQVETNALDLYIKIFREIEKTDAKKVFTILIDEEKHHLSRLGKLLGERIT